MVVIVSLKSTVHMISFESVSILGWSCMRGKCILFHFGSKTKVQEVEWSTLKRKMERGELADKDGRSSKITYLKSEKVRSQAHLSQRIRQYSLGLRFCFSKTITLISISRLLL